MASPEDDDGTGEMVSWGDDNISREMASPEAEDEDSTGQMLSSEEEDSMGEIAGSKDDGSRGESVDRRPPPGRMKPSRFLRHLERCHYYDCSYECWINFHRGGFRPPLVDAYTGVITSTLDVKIPVLVEKCWGIKHRRRAFADLFYLWKVLHRRIRPALVAVAKMAAKPPEEVERWSSRAREMTYCLEDDIDSLLSDFEHTYKRAVLDMARRWKIIWSSLAVDMPNVDCFLSIGTEDTEKGERPPTGLTLSSLPFDPLLKSADEIVGLAEQVNEVISLLMDDQKELKVLCIVGQGGLGKTTLANQVYGRVRGQFDCTALVSVSRDPDLNRVFKEIIRDLGFPEHLRGDATGCDILGTLPHDKRYLIILDDVWDTRFLVGMMVYMPWTDCGNRVIITTRIMSPKIFHHYDGFREMHNKHIYNMKPLSNEDSQKLFFGRIFGSKDSCPEDLKKVSKAILKRCRGLPLAVTSICGLLGSKPRTIEEWKKVHISMGQDSREVADMNSILSLSFHDLPYHLKTCMLYLSIFPEDYVIRREQLVWRWIAEGFITISPDLTLESQGNTCFDELIKRSLIQPVDIQYDGRAKGCRVHDMVLELIISISTKLNFVTVRDQKERKFISDDSYRLSYHSNNVENAVREMSSEVASHIRSFNLFGSVKEVPHLGDFKAMRVLDLGSCRSINNNNIKIILRLFLLEYLSLYRTVIKELPDEICNLKHLQTLDLRECRISKLPATFARLQKLQRLLVDNDVKLPDDIGNMQALELLLSVSMCRNTIKFLEELGKLIRMSRLEITFGRPSDIGNEVTMYTYSLVSSLNKLANLKTLKVHAREGSPLDSMIDICPIFKSLRKLIIGYISRIPTWIQSLTYVVHLEIQVVTLGETDLYILQRMSCLLYLKLNVEGALNEKLIVGNEGFRGLKEFHLLCSKVRIRLVFEGGAMSMLKTLHLCLVARGAISEDGGVYSSIGHLSSLENLHAEVDCSHSTMEEVEAMEASIIRAALEHPNKLTFSMQKNCEVLMVIEEEEEEEVEEEEEEEEEDFTINSN